MTNEPDSPDDYRNTSVRVDSSMAKDIEWIKKQFGTGNTSEVFRRAIKHLVKSLQAEAVYFEHDGHRNKSTLS